MFETLFCQNLAHELERPSAVSWPLVNELSARVTAVAEVLELFGYPPRHHVVISDDLEEAYLEVDRVLRASLYRLDDRLGRLATLMAQTGGLSTEITVGG